MKQRRDKFVYFADSELTATSRVTSKQAYSELLGKQLTHCIARVSHREDYANLFSDEEKAIAKVFVSVLSREARGLFARVMQRKVRRVHSNISAGFEFVRESVCMYPINGGILRVSCMHM
jgi:hypothetical protein